MPRVIAFPLLLSLFLPALSLRADAVFGEPVMLRQPDGREIAAYVFGDEFHQRLETAEGFTLVRNEASGWIEFARLENGRLAPSGIAAGAVDPALLERLGFDRHLSDRAARLAGALSGELLRERPQLVWRPAGASSRPMTGRKKILAVCVQFQPEENAPVKWPTGSTSPAAFGARLFTSRVESLSLANYYDANSYGQLEVNGAVYPEWVTLPKTASAYKAAGKIVELFHDALRELRRADPDFPLAPYADADGNMHLILIYAGARETWGTFYWAYAFRTGESWKSEFGVNVTNCSFVNERNSNGTENTDVRVFCHEYCHMIGGPDLYDYSTFQTLPVGSYCIMGGGGTNVNFCGYIKWRAFGWSTPEPVVASGRYAIDALALAQASSPRLYKIDIEPPFEYLLLENRFMGADPTYESASRQSGLLVTHIDEKYPAAACQPGYPFYGVESLVPGLDPAITTLEEYARLYGKRAFAADWGFTRIGPAYPDDQPAGAYLTLSSGQDTERVIYRNTQGHRRTTAIEIFDIGAAGPSMSFSVASPLPGSTVPISLAVERIFDGAWLVPRKFARIRFVVAPAADVSAIAKYQVIRRIPNRGYTVIAEVSPAQLANGAHEMIDDSLSWTQSYSFMVLGIDASGAVIAASPERSIK